MHIQSARFGPLNIDPAQVLTFPRGLIGFSDQHRFILLPDTTSERFSWLQSLDDPDTAFLLTDPTFFFKGYTVVIKEETSAELQLECGTAAHGCAANRSTVRILVICNKVGDWLTGNLLGPIAINADNLLATQIVLTEKKWTTRQPIARLAQDPHLQPLAKAA